MNKTTNGLPKDAKDWTEEDWRILHEAIESVKARVRQNHMDITLAEVMQKTYTPEHAWKDAAFLKAVGMIWGYYHSPATHFEKRFGDNCLYSPHGTSVGIGELIEKAMKGNA